MRLVFRGRAYAPGSECLLDRGKRVSKECMFTLIYNIVFYLAVTIILAAPSLLFPIKWKNARLHALPLLYWHSVSCVLLWSLAAAVVGSCFFAAVFSVFLLYALNFASRVKFFILGEPILFSDILSLRELLRNPRFFLFSLPPLAWIGGILLILLLMALTCISFRLSPPLHVVSFCTAGLALLVYRSASLQKWAPKPNWRDDVGRLGLLAMSVLYWRQWRSQPSPAPRHPPTGIARRDVVIVVQCESFALPAMFPQQYAQTFSLPNLARAKENSVCNGPLLVSGFGAYTMRTEYGVLFGREEAELGFWQYDPFLTAQKEKTFALSYRLKAAGYHTVFIHPHNLSFYGRDILMPEIGFADVEDCTGDYAPSPDMPYMPDSVLADHMIQKMESTSEPLFLYAVTMENHAPWAGQGGEPLGQYLRHLRGSDDMLGRLLDTLSRTDRKCLLVFFGDHRPSIPGVNSVTEERSTPYVCVTVPSSPETHPVECSMTPAQLNSLIEELAITS